MKLGKFSLAVLSAFALLAAPAMAQNTSAPAAADLILLSRQDANGVGTQGAVTVAKAFNTAGIGYSAGAGGAVTQITSRTTGVTLNNLVGAITLVSAAGSATAATFTVTNSAVGANDVIMLAEKSGTDLLELFVTNVAAGSFKITFFTTGGTTTEQPVVQYAVIKGAVS